MKRSKFLLLAILALVLAGCSLARAEMSPEAGDRWVGFYVVPSRSGHGEFYNNPHLEEYGTVEAETDQFGVLTFTREVLFAVEDEVGNVTFPGIETGFSLFYLEETADDGSHCSRVISNMGANENGLHIADRDGGKSVSISGTVYCGPPLGVTEWDPYGDGTVWYFYRVYQSEDGRVYLNGDGDSANAPLTHTSTETRTVQTNGETVQEETLSVTAAIEAVPRLERLTVTQFSADNAALRTEELSLRDDRPEVRCLPETAWVLVEEVSGSGVERAVYSVPEGEDPVSHDYVLLDDNGFGRPAYLHIYDANQGLKYRA